jgi:Flp pilus assembly protein TadG
MMRKMSRRVGRDESAQVIVEFAVVLPLVVFMICGAIQLGMLGYGSIVARYAAFHGLRAAALVESGDRENTAKHYAGLVVLAAPMLSFTGAEVKAEESSFPDGPDETRLRMTVRVNVPRLLPASWLSHAEARCVMPMEPVDWEGEY